MRWFFYACLLVPVAAVLSVGAARGAEVVAMTGDGRVLAGVVDSRTDDDKLWLRRDTSNISIALSACWDDLASVELHDETIDKSEFRRLAAKLATQLTVSEVLASSGRDDITDSSLMHGRAHARSGQVAALKIAVSTINWDADSSSDGLKVLVTPVDGLGRPVPARGELTLRLFGVKQTSRHARRFEQLTQWSTPVAVSDFQEGMAVYRMPLRGIASESDTDIGAIARVEARLGVFGVGSYVATAPVRLRAFDPLADQLQLSTGQRSFRGERSRARRNPAPVGDGLFFSAPVGP